MDLSGPRLVGCGVYVRTPRWQGDDALGVFAMKTNPINATLEGRGRQVKVICVQFRDVCVVGRTEGSA